MLKKIVCLLVAIIMSCSVLTGCKLISDDTETEARKVVMTVESYKIAHPTEEGKSYTTPKHTIYKSEFENIFNAYVHTYEQYYGMTPAEVADELLYQLSVEKIVLNLANAYIDFGQISLGQYEKNAIKQSVYADLDGIIDTYITEIREENGEIVVEEEEEEDEHDHDHIETTYPTREVVEGAYDRYSRDMLVEDCQSRGLIPVIDDSLDEAERDKIQDRIDAYTVYQLKSFLEKNDRENTTEAWNPSLSRYPGLYAHSSAQRSLELEAFNRALKEIKTQVLALYDITDEDKQKVEADFELFTNVTNTKGLSYVYGVYGDSHTAYLLSGELYEDNQKMTLLEEYITNGVSVTHAEVEQGYHTYIQNQIKNFDADITVYESNINKYAETLYFPSDNYFFVKHVLIPFSDAQTTQLNAYKNGLDNLLNGDYEDYRNRLAAEITSYEHVDGEDFGEPKSVQTIYNEIVSTVNSLNTLRDKERAFDELMYKYNTDPGVFDTMYGYIELYDLNGTTEKYMQEFADAARELYDGGKEGALSGMVVTDYGVHVLYLTKLPKAGEKLGLYDYFTYAEDVSVYEFIEETVLAQKTSQVYADWRIQQVDRYREMDGVINVNDSVVKRVHEGHTH